MTFRHILILAFMGIGLGHVGSDVVASEPSIYSKMLTPSPLGKNRILILCSLKNGDEKIVKKIYESTNWYEFAERDTTFVEISKNAVESVLGTKTTNRARHHDYGNELRRRANCNDDLEFVLIGKDTGVKARWTDDFTQEDLFSRIDAMPMRRYEMQEKKKYK